MSVERDPEVGAVWAVCDGCGERMLLDDEPFGLDEAALAAGLEDAGWDRRPPERHNFRTGAYGDRGGTVLYAQDYCPDCRHGERPRPLFGAHRHRPRVAPGEPDPCDEWPRAAVFEAVGLTQCGHPSPGAPTACCAWCEAGYPIGRVDQWWRR